MVAFNFRHNEYDPQAEQEVYSHFIYFVELEGELFQEEVKSSAVVVNNSYKYPKRKESFYIQFVSSITSFFTQFIPWNW